MPQGRQHVRPRAPASSTEFISEVSDQKTIAFVKKVLCTGTQDGKRIEDAQLEELLPPLTSSNAVDLQLYAFIAIIIQEHVNSWYSNITLDKDFVHEIIQIIAHCTRALEQRFRKLGLTQLLFDQIPSLLDAHVEAWRLAQRAASSSTTVASVQEIYHSLRPHPALTNVRPEEAHEGAVPEGPDSSYRRLLASGILAVLLPDEDIQNPCLFALVSDVLADLVFGELIAKRLSDPDFIYNMVLNIAGSLPSKFGVQPWITPPTHQHSSKLTESGLLSAPRGDEKVQPRAFGTRLWLALTTIGRFTLLAALSVRNLMIILLSASSMPNRRAVETPPWMSHNTIGMNNSEEKQKHETNVEEAHTALATRNGVHNHAPRPVISLQIWSATAHLSRIDQRIPWLRSVGLSLKRLALVGPGQMGCTNSLLDRLLAHQLLTPLTDQSLLPDLLRRLRESLFPGNASPAPPVDPLQPHPSSAARAGRTDNDAASSERRHSLQRAAAIALLNCVPRPLARFFYGADMVDASHGALSARETHRKENEHMIDALSADMLSPFEDPVANRHVVYAIMELIVSALMPELRVDVEGEAQGSVAKLLAERGV